MDNQESRSVALKVATEGAILLKNDGTLPLKKQSRIALLGKGQCEYFAGGGGSARVTTTHKVTVRDGICECAKNGKLSVDPDLLNAYSENPDCVIPPEMLEAAARRSPTAVLVISRFSSEGRDENDEPGSFLLTSEEKKLFSDIKHAGFERIVLLINAGNHIELEWAENDPAVNAILFLGYGGMYGGIAAADL
ncbi:MAG: glycoside hydrolase family 3 C-terminal domain-containing protein, partial [Lentisphaeria bacterium]|nr:glycoside hydrolase family 3 C-terminal domain-containing protein [Lentisphaeria bacterium]